MAEYIEKTEELILAVNAGARVIENTKRYHGASYCIDVFSADHKEIPYLKAAEVLRGFDEIPAADVAPVVHGRWIRTDDQEFILGDFECSVCEHLECDIDTRYLTPGENCLFYCSNCGAKMDAEG